MSYVVEKHNPHAAESLLDRWECPDAWSAALRFESEASPPNWPAQDIAEELIAEGLVFHTDPDTGIEMQATRA